MGFTARSTRSPKLVADATDNPFRLDTLPAQQRHRRDLPHSDLLLPRQGPDPCVFCAVPLGLNTRQRKRLVIRRRRSQADERSSPVAGNTGAQTGGRLRKGIKKPAISRDLKLRIAAVQDRRSRSSTGHRSRSALATSPAPGTVAPFDRVCDLQGRVAAHLSPGRFE